MKYYSIWPDWIADLSPKTDSDDIKLDVNIGETRVWRLDSGPNLQPWDSIGLLKSH